MTTHLWRVEAVVDPPVDGDPDVVLFTIARTRGQAQTKFARMFEDHGYEIVESPRAEAVSPSEMMEEI